LPLFHFQDNLSKPAPDFNEARDDEVVMASAGRYANHLHLGVADNHASTSPLK